MKYSETSLILDIYTKEMGLLSFIISGVRKAKSKLANVFHPMNIIDIWAFYSEDKLCRIKEAHLCVRYSDMNFNVVKSSIAMFLIDLSRNAIQEKESNEELYSFIKTYLVSLDSDLIDLKYAPLHYIVRLADYLGFSITNNYTSLDKYFDLKEGCFIDKNVGHNHILSESLSRKLEELLSSESPQFNKQERNDLLDEMLNYYRHHIEAFRPLKSIKVLRTVLG